MVNAEAEALKEAGNALLKDGDLDGALEKYSAAIDNDPTNHIYYSNRSAANMKAGLHTMALADSQRCIELAPSWSKGYSRAGAAYTALGDVEKAREAYAKSQRLGGAGTPSSAATGVSGAATAGASGSLTTAEKALVALRMFFVLNFIMFLVPGLGNSSMFTRALLAAAGTYGAELFRDYGARLKGQPAQMVMQTIVPDWRIHYMLTAILFAIGGSPRVILLLPHALAGSGHIAEIVIRIQPKLAVFVGTTFKLDTLVFPRFANTTPERWADMSTSQRWTAFNAATLKACAALEVAVGFSLIADLFTSQRSIVTLFAYWHFMKIRYMTSEPIKAVFKAVDERLLSLMQRLPPALKIYMKVRTYCVNQVRMPTAEEARAQQEAGIMGSLRQQASNCNIM